MPTFSAIALDRLLEPGTSKSVEKTVPILKPVPKLKPAPRSKLERRHGTALNEKKVIRPQMSPALYATPEATPLPDSPSSFPPSPYIINHKRRGPRLLKSSSVDNVSSRQIARDSETGNTDLDSKKKGVVTYSIPEHTEEPHENSVHCSSSPEKHANGTSEDQHTNGLDVGEAGSNTNNLGIKSFTNGSPKNPNAPKHVKFNLEIELRDSMSLGSNTDVEDNAVAESCASFNTPMGEFFDAWEELSSESGHQPSPVDYNAELREVRLSLLMEIEKRKQAEEVLEDMRTRWQRIRQQLATVGLTLPADLIATRAEGEPPDSDPCSEELCQQVYIARTVSEAIGKGMAKAEVEVEMEMETQIESKNFEISRLLDRLKYYEAVNREMTQRNQEIVETARRDRRRQKRIHKWVWGSVVVAITLGSAVLAWSYLPTSKSNATDNSGAPEDK